MSATPRVPAAIPRVGGSANPNRNPRIADPRNSGPIPSQCENTLVPPAGVTLKYNVLFQFFFKLVIHTVTQMCSVVLDQFGACSQNVNRRRNLVTFDSKVSACHPQSP